MIIGNNKNENEPESPDRWVFPGEIRVDLNGNMQKLALALQQCGETSYNIQDLKKKRAALDDTIKKLEENIPVITEQIAKLYENRNRLLDKACYKHDVLPSMYNFDISRGIAVKKQEFK